jgi:hypothetical protein
VEAAWIGVIGVLAGAALGSGITILGTRRLSKDERVAAEHAENLRAFRLFVSEAALSVSELRQLPSVPKPWPTDAAVTWLTTLLRGGEAGAQMATRRRVYQQYGNRYEDLAGRFAAAYMDLRLRDLPSSVDATVERTADYIARLGEDRTPELKDEWKVIHAALMASGDELKAVARSSSHKLTGSTDQRGSESQPSA